MTDLLDPELKVALVHVPRARRPALEALFGLDAAFGSVLAGGRDPMISRIRLAWWREALEKLDREPAPPEPTLADVARHLLPAGLTGSALAAMEEGWAVLTEAGPLSAQDLDSYARARGGRLFVAAARLLGGDAAAAEAGGEAWALADLARRSSNREEVAAALAAARARRRPGRWPRALRPLGMLALLASRDADRGLPEPQGSPGRLLLMLRHRLTGR